MDCCNHLFNKFRFQDLRTSDSPSQKRSALHNLPGCTFLSQNRKDLDKKHAIMRKYSKIFIAQYCAIWYIPKSLLSINQYALFYTQHKTRKGTEKATRSICGNI